MIFFPTEKLEDLLNPHDLVEALREAFRGDITVPLRQHYPVDHPKGTGMLLLMPAWSKKSGFGGVKMVTTYPTNAEQGLPSIYGAYTLFDQTTGIPLAIMDGRILTLHRTAAASVLAATYLARPDSRRLLMVGTGQLAPYIVRTYVEVLGINEVKIWGRNPDKARQNAASLQEDGINATASENLNQSSAWADVISCATLSENPLIYGEWLKPGTHVDLIGGFTPAMRETDDFLIRDASLFVDTREGALSEAGDLLQPIDAGVITESHILADLYELARGVHPGRADAHEITCFKSVGTALEDLAAAELVWRSSGY